MWPDLISIFLRILLHLQKKSLMENFIFCVVFVKMLRTKISAPTLYLTVFNDFWVILINTSHDIWKTSVISQISKRGVFVKLENMA